MEIPAARVLEILAALGFSPVREGDAVRVTVPSWRVDVACEEDLIEEVIRCEGYDRLPETLPRPYAPARPRPEALVADRARDLLAGLGLLECQTYSFVSDAENFPVRVRRTRARPSSSRTRSASRSRRCARRP